MKLGLLLAMFCMACCTYAQSLERRVIGSAGGTSTTAAAIITWNVGEAVVNTLSAASVILTQGFEQPPIPSSSVKSVSVNSNIMVYPNPTSGVLNISIKNSLSTEVYKAEVRDIAGKLIMAQNNLELSKGIATLDMGHVSDGCYFLQLSTENRNMTTFKITLIK